MTVSHHKPNTAAFAVSVETQRARLEKAYAENDHYPHSSLDYSARLNVHAPASAFFVQSNSVGAVAGAVLASVLVAGGWYVDHVYVTSDRNNGGALAGAVMLGIFAWVLTAIWVNGRYVAPHIVPTTRFAKSLFIDVESALDEIDEAADAPGAARHALNLREAALAMVPGFDTLAAEEHRLTGEIRRSFDAHRTDYRAAVVAARDGVRATMLDVAAELIAAASVVFAARDDLVVKLADQPSAEDVIIHNSLLTDEINATLAAARTKLREAAATV